MKLNLSRASEWSSLPSGVVVKTEQLKCRPRHLTMVQNYEVRLQKPSSSRTIAGRNYKLLGNKNYECTELKDEQWIKDLAFYPFTSYNETLLGSLGLSPSEKQCFASKMGV
ncbi:hypothetical protein TNCV_3533941 [Trichonephila clavipes]|nr:hypothetical protein TNCV_3533941 [Trichonephila clavipes]